ncbi:TetR/AcrR family transcriptional regulator [Nonomuraea typhae]|uniref:TetR/AcrR family transcriptional regulator n=1 Tax=Nonomuraea typhae TaxID=2603600 RepID=A0ABW7Z9F2_9ACTN
MILDRAGRLMDDEGLAAVTIRRLARDLGVRPMALYTHFTGKEEILAALYGRLLAGLEVPESPGAGLDGVRQMMLAYFRLLVEHADLVKAGSGGQGDLRHSEIIYTLLLNAGMDRRTAVGVTGSLSRLAVGSAALHREDVVWDSEWSRLRDSLRELPGDRYPVLRSYGQDLPEFTQEEMFAFGVDLILRAAVND